MEGGGGGLLLVLSLATSYYFLDINEDGMLTSTLSIILKYDIQLMYMYIIQLSYFIDIKRDRILNHEHTVPVQYTTLSKIRQYFLYSRACFLVK